MERQAISLGRFNFKTRVSVFLAYGLAKLALSNAQFTACTTRGNHTEDIYREVPIKNGRTSVTLSSPNFPKPYPQNIQCTWRILVPIGYQVKLSFLEFDLEESYQESGCHDYVSVRDGGLVFKEAKEISKRCGKSTEPPTVSTSNSVLWIRFLTDKEVEKKGFSIKVLPARGSTSKRYIAIGVLVSLLLIIIIAIILCRKRFKRNDTETPKVRQYQELPIPMDVEQEQRDPSMRGPEITEEDPWSSASTVVSPFVPVTLS